MLVTKTQDFKSSPVKKAQGFMKKTISRQVVFIFTLAKVKINLHDWTTLSLLFLSLVLIVINWRIEHSQKMHALRYHTQPQIL